MARLKLTKIAVDGAAPHSTDYELRDAVIPRFLLKVTPTGRKVFMIQYRTNAGERRNPAIGRFGEITVEQAKSIAQDWLAEVRRGKDLRHFHMEESADGDEPSDRLHASFCCYHAISVPGRFSDISRGAKSATPARIVGYSAIDPGSRDAPRNPAIAVRPCRWVRGWCRTC
jgi:Arm DNA-binding domain